MKNLRLLREQNNLTQQQMADIFKIQRPTYSRYENGERQPDLSLLLEIAKHFDVTVDYLLGREEKPSENSNDLSNKIMELFNRLDEKHQQQVIEYTRFVLSLGDDEQN